MRTSLVTTLFAVAACGGSTATSQPVVSSTAPDPEPEPFRCPPADQLEPMVLVQNEYNPAPEPAEGVNADVETADGDYMGNAAFHDLDGDGDLDLLIGSCVHEDCDASVQIRCGEDAYVSVWQGSTIVRVGRGTSQVGGVAWRKLETVEGGLADPCTRYESLAFDGKTYAPDGESRQECEPDDDE